MRKTNFFGHEIKRLIVGDNPFGGHSYIEDVIPGSEMRDYCYNSKKIYDLYFELEEAGFDCLLPLADPFYVQMLKEYKRDGGKMKLIFQSYSAMLDAPMIRQLVDLDPAALYISGTKTDVLHEADDIQGIKDVIQLAKDILQKPIGLGTHRPKVVIQSEEEDWGADFYMCSLHNLRRGREGEPSGFITGKTKSGVPFYEADRSVMLDVIANTKKTCIAYKIFAGGHKLLSKDENEVRAAVKDCYKEVYSKIKPNDLAVIGVFPKYKDQITEDMQIFNEYMDELEGKN